MNYPATYVGAGMFIPSFLLSLDDILLPSKFIKGVLVAYNGSINEID